MSTETPDTPVAATPPTPENVADMLTSGDNDYHDGNQWKPSLYADGNVLHIGITPYSEPDEDDLDDEPVKLPEVHFRAVVVEGEQTPIVLQRPDLTDGYEFEGGHYDDHLTTGWQVVAVNSDARTVPVEDANSILFRGSGHITTAEARRFAAALVAKADAVEAAQAEQERAR